jgi:hypothetical protein
MYRPPRGTVGRPPVGDEISPNAENWNTFAQEESPGGLGLNQPQAAGLVGNLQAESGPQIKPVGVVGDNGTAFGAAQWRGPRLAGLKQYAAERGIDPFTTEAQQGFTRRELIGDAGQGPSEGGAYNALAATGTPGAAATAVDKLYERSSGAHRGRRIANAENIAAALPNPRDAVAATLASRPPPPEGGQDARLAEVTGMNQPVQAFAPTASRVGDVQSDMPPITGGVQGPAGASVIDSVQQRQQGFQQPQLTPTPGPQLAQAGPFPPPTLDASGRPAAIIPGGGLPQVMQQPIQAAPQDPRAAIKKMPNLRDTSDDPEPPPPRKPQGIGPEERRLQKQLYGDVDDRVRAAAQAVVTKEQSDRSAEYENQLKMWELQKADWLKRRELVTKGRIDQPKTDAEIRNLGLQGDEQQVKNADLPTRLALERRKLEAQVGTEAANAKTATKNAEFYDKTGREREPFLKAFEVKQQETRDSVSLLKNANIAKQALDTGKVTFGWGGENKLQIARGLAALGNKNAADVAALSEQYKTASDATLAYGVRLFNGGDRRVTEGDLDAAKGLTGNLNLQRAAQERLISVMQEDLHGKIGKYEDDREAYLKGDPQHQFFKVETPKVEPAMRDALMKDPENQFFQSEFDRTYGKGAAALELRRVRRRMHQEDN